MNIYHIVIIQDRSFKSQSAGLTISNRWVYMPRHMVVAETDRVRNMAETGNGFQEEVVVTPIVGTPFYLEQTIISGGKLSTIPTSSTDRHMVENDAWWADNGYDTIYRREFFDRSKRAKAVETYYLVTTNDGTWRDKGSVDYEIGYPFSETHRGGEGGMGVQKAGYIDYSTREPRLILARTILT